MDSVEPLTAEAELLKCIDFMQTCGDEIPIEVIVLNAIFYFLSFPVYGASHQRWAGIIH